MDKKTQRIAMDTLSNYVKNIRFEHENKNIICMIVNKNVQKKHQII